MSVNNRVTLIQASLCSDGVADERATEVALCRVGIRMLEHVHRVPRTGVELEPVATAGVVDRDAQAVRFAVPEERDCDSVVLPICQFLLHDNSLIWGAASFEARGFWRNAASQRPTVRAAA